MLRIVSVLQRRPDTPKPHPRAQKFSSESQTKHDSFRSSARFLSKTSKLSRGERECFCLLMTATMCSQDYDPSHVGGKLFFSQDYDSPTDNLMNLDFRNREHVAFLGHSHDDAAKLPSHFQGINFEVLLLHEFIYSRRRRSHNRGTLKGPN